MGANVYIWGLGLVYPVDEHGNIEQSVISTATFYTNDQNVLPLGPRKHYGAWKCQYCGMIQNQDVYNCQHCGAPGKNYENQ